MADKITRKFSDYRTKNGVIQTTQNWIVEVVDESGKVAELKNSNIEFKCDNIEGCPPVPEAEDVEISIGGFVFTYYGKNKKNGELTIPAFEDVTGVVGKLHRAIQRTRALGNSSNSKPSEATMIADKKYYEGNKDVRFKVTVKLADNAGNVTRTWTFFDAIGKSEVEGELGQEAGTLKYKFTFVYSMHTEDGGDKW